MDAVRSLGETSAHPAATSVNDPVVPVGRAVRDRQSVLIGEDLRVDLAIRQERNAEDSCAYAAQARRESRLPVQEVENAPGTYRKNYPEALEQGPAGTPVLAGSWRVLARVDMIGGSGYSPAARRDREATIGSISTP